MQFDRPVLIQELDAVVLAGGESRRMGRAKADLPWAGTTMLGAALAVLMPLFRRVIVVTRDKSELASPGVEVLEDESSVRGPLAGIACGLASSQSEWTFVVGCDMPFMLPQVIHRMAESLGHQEILAANLEGHHQPLHAFYSRSCLGPAQELLDQGISSPMALFAICQIHSLYAADFLDIDPDLSSFKDLDTWEEYRDECRANGRKRSQSLG